MNRFEEDVVRINQAQVAAMQPALATISNGSFEEGPAETSGFVTVYPGSDAIPGWTITQGNIDHFYSDASEGTNFIDLNGEAAVGGISQTIDTVVGQNYIVTFDMKGSGGGNSLPIKRLQVRAANQNGDYSYDTSTSSTWDARSFEFTAIDESTTIEFVSSSTEFLNRFRGPLLDNVQIVAGATSLPIVTVAATDPTANEVGSDVGQFTLTLSDAAMIDTTVHYTINGTAENGTDYSFLTDTATITAGQTTATIDIFPIDDSVREGNETVTLSLVDDDAYRLDTMTSATVAITDNEPIYSSIFADAVVFYEPDFGGGAVPAEPNYADSTAAIGPPDYDADTEVGSVSLGSGGRITLEFTDNVLTGSGTAAPDLLVLEIGSGVEETIAEISVDGTNFISVGRVAGGTATLDIDPFLLDNGFDASTEFRFIRLQDDPNQGSRSGVGVGADIDAIATLNPSIFADAMVSYEPYFGGGAVPAEPNYADPTAAIGPPDYDSNTEVGSVSLGAGGRITLEFTDNVLTGSGSAAPDLLFLEIGSDVERSIVEISVDGTDFISVGSVEGGTATLDIDPFLLDNGFDAFTEFRFVRLQDDPNQGYSFGIGVGADIDAIATLNASTAVNRTILGTHDNDDLVGTVGNDEIFGLRGDDDLSGGAGDDRLDGDRGDDFLFGGAGNDRLNGDRGDDRLIGVAEIGVNLGSNEIDTLIGGYGADEFVLGDATQPYYSDGMSDDYAIVQDFDSSEDVIVLHGASGEYSLGTAGAGLPSGTAIFRVDSSGSDELVAIVQGDPLTALNIESVLYV